MAVLAPWVSINDPIRADVFNIKSAPSRDHILGTDSAGRDIFARIVHAGRVSLSVGIVAALISSAIGTIIGLISGYVGGWVDNLLQRFTELVMTFPSFFALIILVSVVGPSVYNLMIVIGFLGWTGKARLVRGQVLSVRQMDYVTAARAVGANQSRLMFIHILPSVMGYVAVAGMLTVAGAIITEASLSFLGLGVRMPTPTWGNMITGAQSLFVLKELPWIWVPPGVAISITVIAVNFVGDGLRDALDPRTRIE
jgi:peptide/nickel transport system permease protein